MSDGYLSRTHALRERRGFCLPRSRGLFGEHCAPELNTRSPAIDQGITTNPARDSGVTDTPSLYPQRTPGMNDPPGPRRDLRGRCLHVPPTCLAMRRFIRAACLRHRRQLVTTRARRAGPREHGRQAARSKRNRPGRAASRASNSANVRAAAGGALESIKGVFGNAQVVIQRGVTTRCIAPRACIVLSRSNALFPVFEGAVPACRQRSVRLMRNSEMSSAIIRRPARTSIFDHVLKGFCISLSGLRREFCPTPFG
jgi:hypothetical protein